MIKEEKLEELLIAIITMLVVKGICTQKEFQDVLETTGTVRKEKQNENPNV